MADRNIHLVKTRYIVGTGRGGWVEILNKTVEIRSDALTDDEEILAAIK